MTSESDHPKSTDPVTPKPAPPNPGYGFQRRQTNASGHAYGGLGHGLYRIFTSLSLGQYRCRNYHFPDDHLFRRDGHVGLFVDRIWHKYVIYWGTIALVVFFMFKSPQKPAE